MTDTLNYKHILISRVDAIGDVVLTLPMCGYIKSIYPDVKISFLGRTYTEPVIKTCTAIDHFINYDDLKKHPEDDQITILRSKCIDAIVHVYPQKELASIAKSAGIKCRIGTTNRWYHWLTCNKLVGLSRKDSPLHEAQLNISLLQPLGIYGLPLTGYLPNYYNFELENPLAAQHAGLLSNSKFNLVLHPKSNGSGKEWGLDKFEGLINLLPPENFNIFISGSDKEKELLKDWLPTLPQHVTDVTGKFKLQQFIAFLASANGLVSASTGPLHIAALTGIHALGLYPGVKPANAARWGPIGERAEYIETTTDDLEPLTPADVYEKIEKWINV